MPTPPSSDAQLAQYLPFSAWEQAVFVTLFIVFCAGVFFSLRWIIKAITDLTDNFQKYLKSRDEQNQTFLTAILDRQSSDEKLREEQFGNRNNALADALDRNTQALMSLQQYVATSLTEMRQSILRGPKTKL